MKITKRTLLLHEFGLVDSPDVKKQLDDLIQNDPVVGYAYDRLRGELPEVTESVNRFAESILQELDYEATWERILATGQDEVLNAEDYEFVTRASIVSDGMDRLSSSLELQLGGSPQDDEQNDVKATSERGYVTLNLSRRTIEIRYPIELIPNGLARMIYTSLDHRITTKSLTIIFNEFAGVWSSKMSIDEFTSDRSPSLSHFIVKPLTEEELLDEAFFAETSSFVASLENLTQRELAEKFLASVSGISERDE